MAQSLYSEPRRLKCYTLIMSRSLVIKVFRCPGSQIVGLVEAAQSQRAPVQDWAARAQLHGGFISAVVKTPYERGLYMNVYECVYKCIHVVCMYIYVYMYMLCMYICIYVYMYICIYVYVYVYVYVRAFLKRYSFVRINFDQGSHGGLFLRAAVNIMTGGPYLGWSKGSM